VAPSARRNPISERRSGTEITITLAIPTPPTSSATAPRPRNNDVKAVLAAARASRASDGRETCSGSSGAPSKSRTSCARSWSARTKTVEAVPSASKSSSAIGKPISAAVSSWGASVIASRMPMTVNQRPPSHMREPVSATPSVVAASAPSTTAG
jgi:hypothetical protein